MTTLLVSVNLPATRSKSPKPRRLAGLMLAGFASGALYAVRPALPLWVALVGCTGMIAATIWLRKTIAGWVRARDEVAVELVRT